MSFPRLGRLKLIEPRRRPRPPCGDSALPSPAGLPSSASQAGADDQQGPVAKAVIRASWAQDTTRRYEMGSRAETSPGITQKLRNSATTM
jgi:hypothetical protein